MWRTVTKAGGALLMAATMLVAMFGAASVAEAQPQLPNGECFELTVVGSTEIVPIEDYPEVIFGEVAGQETVLTTIPCDTPTADEPDEVLGIVETPGDVLALTGSSVNTPVTIGFSLLGAGGLALYAARRRSDQEQAQLAKEFDELELV